MNNINIRNLQQQQQRKLQQKKTVHFSSEPLFFLYIYYVHFIAFLLRIYNYLFLKTSLPIKEIDETLVFTEKHKQIFLDTFFDFENKTIKNKDKWNENIDPRCYSIDFLQNLTFVENNEYELQWKRRLLQLTTPRGNIIMYYDFYKQAFAYVSDQQMPYIVLNACAMKYVRVFRCFDFFIDVNILPFDLVSPFSIIQEEIDKKDREKITEKKKEKGILFDNTAFIKPILKKKENEIPNNSSILKRDYRNNFRYLGKMSNLSLLMKIVPIKKHPVLSIPVESFDYVSFKKMQQQNKS
jgi:hypothetical protein